MGTDIHGVFQRHNPTTNAWEDISSNYEFNRHYQLFAVLAGVRNGVGFAGVRTGDPVKPISKPRGLPEDFLLVDEAHPVASIDILDPFDREWRKKNSEVPLEIWMGDHSHSWLTSDEMLAWAEKSPEVQHMGVLSRATYEAWDKVSPPPEYSGAVWGKDIVVVDDTPEGRATPGWTHVQCFWTAKLKDELAYFFDEVARLVAEHGRVRFVFGFDS